MPKLDAMFLQFTIRPASRRLAKRASETRPERRRKNPASNMSVDFVSQREHVQSFSGVAGFFETTNPQTIVRSFEGA
jgi:hypothetical protein